MTIERDTKLFLIPPGTARSFCKRCGALIYWIDHQCKPKRKGEAGAIKPIPVSMKHALAVEPTDTTWGRGPSHFSDCEFAEQFRHRQQLPQPQGATA